MSATFAGPETVLVSRTLTLSTDDRVDQTEIYQGELSQLLAMQFAVGGSFPSLDGSETVYIVSLDYQTHANGPFAQLTLNASNAIPNIPGGSVQGTMYELDFQRIEKELRTHRKFQPGGGFALSEEDLNKIAAWERESESEKRKTLFDALGASAKECAKRLARGQTSYPIWVPVARKSFYTSKRPILSAVGAIDSPPSLCGAPTATAAGKNYIYVRTSDKATREQGRPWRRETEWMGFDEVDDLIYTNA